MAVLAKEIEATYEVLSKMGEGGMGAVYKVRHKFFDEIRVIKVMQAEIETVDELKERFLGEAKRGKQLRHPNLAEVIDFSVAADGTSYMVMEYIEGVNLRELMTRNNAPLDVKIMIPIAEQVLAALGYLHSKNFVHRDISPDNIMLVNDGESADPRVKLIDLGIAKSLEATAQNLTMAGKFVGKVRYASPEQFSGRVDARSDLYSFGIVLYELLTGAKPITGHDYFSILGGHLQRPPRPFSETDPGNHVPAPVREAILRALEKRPEDRFQSAAEFAAALRSTLAPSEQRTIEKPFTTTVPAMIPPPEVTEVDVAVTEVTPLTPSPSPRTREEDGRRPGEGRTIAASLPRWYPVAAVVALVLLIAVISFWTKSRQAVTKVEPVAVVTAPVTTTTAITAPAPRAVVVDVPAPAEVPGTLRINAFPWGQVTSVTDSAGAERLTSGSAETPLVLSLAPGAYKVTLMNPNSKRSVVLEATVTANAQARVEAELDRVDINRYVDAIGIGR
ncbi:MAG TPA: serine/threonine-protein kinase [Thermoanaerobaculia bacterium]|nr:serine/threonine-protein kinase [Thermoanaerobaculia bacterium]